VCVNNALQQDAAFLFDYLVSEREERGRCWGWGRVQTSQSAARANYLDG